MIYVLKYYNVQFLSSPISIYIYMYIIMNVCINNIENKFNFLIEISNR